MGPRVLAFHLDPGAGSLAGCTKEFDMKMNRLGVWTSAFALAMFAWTGAVNAQKDLPGPIDSLQDLQDTGKMLFKLADDNNDGQISQAEAIDAGNLLVGGFFFRADTNGDGTVSADEARAARDAILKDKPWLRYAVETVRATKAKDGQSHANNQQSPLRALVIAFDTNNDKQLQATELRQAVQTSVQGLFATADTNRDGQLSPSEVNAAMAGAARAVAQAAFQQADKDNNGSLSEAEFTQAITKPAHVMFAVADLNHDGQLSPEEVQTARKAMMAQLRNLMVPEPANSARNLIRSGRAPSEVAPVPNINPSNLPRPNQPAQPTTPAQPSAPARPATPPQP
jgi:Ca2+-binding EF-hand superfamily protein